jgi:transcriptional regulator with XRE-family HTH domain
MDTASIIGQRVKAERIQRGLTQDELSQRVGVSRSAVAQWETGRAGQLMGNLARIGAALDVSVEYLMYGGDTRAALQPQQGDEIALLRLYRACEPEDRQILLRTARRLTRGDEQRNKRHDPVARVD